MKLLVYLLMNMHFVGKKYLKVCKQIVFLP